MFFFFFFFDLFTFRKISAVALGGPPPATQSAARNSVGSPRSTEEGVIILFTNPKKRWF